MVLVGEEEERKKENDDFRFFQSVTVSGKTNLAEIKKVGFCYPWTQLTLGFVVVPVASQ